MPNAEMFAVITGAPLSDRHAYRFEGPRRLFLPPGKVFRFHLTFLVIESPFPICRGKRGDLLVPMDLLRTTSTLFQRQATSHDKGCLGISGDCYLERKALKRPRFLGT